MVRRAMTQNWRALPIVRDCEPRACHTTCRKQHAPKQKPPDIGRFAGLSKSLYWLIAVALRVVPPVADT